MSSVCLKFLVCAVGARDEDLYTPLHRASYNGHAKVIFYNKFFIIFMDLEMKVQILHSGRSISGFVRIFRPGCVYDIFRELSINGQIPDKCPDSGRFISNIMDIFLLNFLNSVLVFFSQVVTLSFD